MRRSSLMEKRCIRGVKVSTIALCLCVIVVNLVALILSKSVPPNDLEKYNTAMITIAQDRRNTLSTTSTRKLLRSLSVTNFTKRANQHQNKFGYKNNQSVKSGNVKLTQQDKFGYKSNQSVKSGNVMPAHQGKFDYKSNQAVKSGSVYLVRQEKSGHKNNRSTKSGNVDHSKTIKPRGKSKDTKVAVSKLHNENNDFIKVIEATHRNLKINQTSFGHQYKPSARRNPTYDFPYIIDGRHICKGIDPFLVIMVLSVHTHIDTRETIRQTWGRAASPGIWPKIGALNETVRLIFLLGRGDKEIKNKIVEEENLTHGDIVQADFQDSYYNLTLKVVNGVRWVAEFCPNAKYILKADEDVFVHVPNLIQVMRKENITDNGAVYGHVNQRSAVFREGKWAVSNETYPLETYPPYVSGNTYVFSGHIASRIFYMAGHLPYMNIEDAFVCGIVRTMIGADIYHVVGFTQWYEKKPRACEFKNNRRISATKTDDNLKLHIWEEQKTKLADCYHVVIKNNTVPMKRPDNHIQNRPSFRHSIRDEHIFFNKTNSMYYVV